MPIPDYQTLMLPVLQLAGDREEHPVADFRKRVAGHFHLTPEDLSQNLKSGTSLLANRVAWAIAYLHKAQFLDLTTRGVYRIAERGATFLQSNQPTLTLKTLKQFPDFVQSLQKDDSAENLGLPGLVPDDKKTPEERLEESFELLRDDLASDLLGTVKRGTPAAFEKIVVQLLVAMGYGGSLDDAGEVVGKSGDGGIDGIIKQDKLGLDVLYVQAKRWENVVGSPEIMKFSGSLTKRHASKGVFITTSYFSKDALEYVRAISQKIVLIGGKQLATLIIDYNVGVPIQRHLY